MIERLVTLISGASGLAAIAIALYFFRFGRESRDRLFHIFGWAFCALGANWWLVGVLSPQTEAKAWLYVIRLFAFVLIIVAVVDKNRSSKK
ncbi:MAG: hypothetical protein IT381_11560 [Deltaproteobacteria bacterium]|nr:hypothetical protein [Deltaproteobacteria bacterium]